MTKKKLKIVIPGGLDIDFKKYLEKNFKSKGVLSNYNIVSVNKKPGELTRELFDADVFITTRWPNKNINAPKLKLIQIPAAGFDNIHFESVPKGCKVSNTFEHEVPIAEYCLLAMLEAEINLNKMNAQLKKGNWNGYFSSSSFHGELFNKNLGGGAILDVGCYPLSMVRLIAGAFEGAPFADPIVLSFCRDWFVIKAPIFSSNFNLFPD